MRRVPFDPPLRLPDTVVAWRRDAPRELARVLASVREAARAVGAQELGPEAERQASEPGEPAG